MFPLGQAHVENVTDIPRSEDLFDLGQTEHASLFDSLGQPWEVRPRIGGYLRDTLEPRQLGQAHSQSVIEGDVFIGEGTVIEAGALIRGPVWIGRNCRIAEDSQIGPYTIIEPNCTIKNGTLIENSVFWAGVTVGAGSTIRNSIITQNRIIGEGKDINEESVI